MKGIALCLFAMLCIAYLDAKTVKTIEVESVDKVMDALNEASNSDADTIKLRHKRQDAATDAPTDAPEASTTAKPSKYRTFEDIAKEVLGQDVVIADWKKEMMEHGKAKKEGFEKHQRGIMGMFDALKQVSFPRTENKNYRSRLTNAAENLFNQI